MNSHLELTYDKSELKEYVKELLTLGVCDLFLKAGFVEKEKRVLATYQTEGFRPLSAVSRLSTEEILSVSVSLLHGFYQSEKHCLFTELFAIEPAWIFADRNYAKVKMVFVPSSEGKAFSEKLAGLLEYLKEKGSEEGTGYIDSAIDFVRSNQYGYKALIHHLENLRREVYLCGVA